MKLKKLRKAIVAALFVIGVIVVAVIVIILILLLLRRARNSEALAGLLRTGADALKAGDETLEVRLDNVAQLHQAAIGGDLDSAREANRKLERLHRAYPSNPLVAAYRGSILVQLSHETEGGRDRLRQVKRGLKLLDTAVAAAPDDLTIRRLRGRVSFRLPEKVFSRTETAVEDYVALIDGERAQPGSVDNDLYARLLTELEEAYERLSRPEDAARIRALAEEHSKRQETVDPNGFS